MKTIRRGVFETNSSSTHSITIIDKDTYNEWKLENNCYDFDTKKIISKEERFKFLIFSLFFDSYDLSSDYIYEKEIQNYFDDNKGYEQVPLTYAEYNDTLEDCELENDVNNFKTKSGDEIIIICRYGRD